MIHVRHKCGATIKIPDSMGETAVICPRCGGQFRAPPNQTQRDIRLIELARLARDQTDQESLARKRQAAYDAVMHEKVRSQEEAICAASPDHRVRESGGATKTKIDFCPLCDHSIPAHHFGKFMHRSEPVCEECDTMVRGRQREQAPTTNATFAVCLIALIAICCGVADCSPRRSYVEYDNRIERKQQRSIEMQTVDDMTRTIMEHYPDVTPERARRNAQQLWDTTQGK